MGVLFKAKTKHMNPIYINRLSTIEKSRVIKITFAVFVILFMTNLNALVDLILHPEIPYFDSEHLIVGALVFLFSTLFFYILYLHFKQLRKTHLNQIEFILGVQVEKEKLKESESKLKELNATKDKLFSIIAHDLRSPFNAILGFSDLLTNNINEHNIEENKKFIEQINNTAKFTLNLLDNLLTWAKSQTGQIEFKPQNIILSEIIQESIEGSEASASIKGISINCSQSKDFEVYADPNMLQIILRNLISNAIKFTYSNGKIDVQAIKTPTKIEITISDNGMGIKEEVKNKLFELDSNITTVGTKKEKGSGLGLILCDELVKKHGGRIWVETELGKGSDFKFTLPFDRSNNRTTLANKQKEYIN